MHEYSLAKNIIEIIKECAVKQNSSRAAEVIIVIGELSGVMPDALKSAVDLLVKRTEFSTTQFVYEIKKGKARCSNCGATIEVPDFFIACKNCGNTSVEMVEGKELYVKTITFE